ncbi:hypothetical protein [Dactylosporangium sp. NPDC050588]|uniref:hypothetical protein n=1 Tax=Dactylosporangium sp. NPDC050588 TaxID=3157211 RepID=UPI0033EF1EB6
MDPKPPAALALPAALVLPVAVTLSAAGGLSVVLALPVTSEAAVAVWLGIRALGRLSGEAWNVWPAAAIGAGPVAVLVFGGFRWLPAMAGCLAGVRQAGQGGSR